MSVRISAVWGVEGKSMGKEYDRHSLVTALNEVLVAWQAEHGKAGSALCALDALGYTAGTIFAMAPNRESQEGSRLLFMHAMDEGMQMNCTIH